MTLTFEEYEKLEARLDKISMEADYIPSMEEINNLKPMLSDEFIPFLVWLDSHHPEPETEEQKQVLLNIRKFLYENLEIL